jgi:hypothetical protein
MTEFRNKEQKFTEEFGTLWKIFTTAATDPGCGNVICVIDALDECEESTRVQLIKCWVDFYSKPNANKPFLKFIVTSRPYRSIEAEFHDLQTIRLRAEDETDATSEDIKLVVKARVQTIGKKRDTSLTKCRTLWWNVSSAMPTEHSFGSLLFWRTLRRAHEFLKEHWISLLARYLTHWTHSTRRFSDKALIAKILLNFSI